MDCRKKPFTDFEKQFLMQLIPKYAEVIENKKTDGATSQKKTTAWENLTQEFNASSKTQDNVTSKQLRKCWLNMKAKAREAKTKENQRNYTGGGPYIPNMSPTHEVVLATTQTILPVINIIDSDQVAEPKDDDDSVFWLHKKNRTKEDDFVTKATEDNPLILTPLQMNTPKPATDVTKPSLKRKISFFEKPEDIKRSILQQDLMQRKKEFENRMQHMKILQEIEVVHKKEMAQLEEEEVKLRIEILKKQLLE